MRTNVILQDDLVRKAAALTHIAEKTALIHEGLKALIERESRLRLAALGGTEGGLKIPSRRRLRKGMGR